MVSAFTDFAEQIVDGTERCSPDLAATLEGMARELVLQARLTGLDLALDGVGMLRLRRKPGGVAAHWQSSMARGGVETDDFNDDHAAVMLAIDIVFAGLRIGTMRYQPPAPRYGDGPLPGAMVQFAQDCGRVSQRYRLEHWSQGRWGRAVRLVGLSHAMRELDRFIEIAAANALPVVIRGEYGTEKLQLAAAIHCCGAQADGAFVSVDCAHPLGLPSDWLADAEGGTLFLANVDELAGPHQLTLPLLLPSRLTQWWTTTRSPSVRIIASTTADLRASVAAGRFSRSFATELDFLGVTIPPVRERIDDIDAMVCEVVARLGYTVAVKCTPAFLAACRAYSWPENQSEIERVVARIATMTGTAPIGDGDIARHVPQVVPVGVAALPPAAPAPIEAAGVSIARWTARAVGAGLASSLSAEASPEPWLDPGELHGVPIALQRALWHLGHRYDQTASLSELAAFAGVSTAQLSALFRTVIGAPFKTLLRHIRIYKARELLADDPTASVTDIAYRVGFADLSYFERSFPGIVGTSPRAFRRGLGRVAPGVAPGVVSSGSVAHAAE